MNRLDLVTELLADLTPGSWAHTFWSRVRAELWRKLRYAPLLLVAGCQSDDLGLMLLTAAGQLLLPL